VLLAPILEVVVEHLDGLLVDILAVAEVVLLPLAVNLTAAARMAIARLRPQFPFSV